MEVSDQLHARQFMQCWLMQHPIPEEWNPQRLSSLCSVQGDPGALPPIHFMEGALSAGQCCQQPKLTTWDHLLARMHEAIPSVHHISGHGACLSPGVTLPFLPFCNYKAPPTVCRNMPQTARMQVEQPLVSP